MAELGSKNPSRASQVAAGAVVAILIGVSLLVAWKVPVPAKRPTAAWNSPWVFRAEVFGGFFIGVYVLGAIVLTTIKTAKPPKKLSFGMLSYEEAEVEKAAEALNEGKTALQALQSEVGALRQYLKSAVSGALVSSESLLEAAPQLNLRDQSSFERRLGEQVTALRDLETAATADGAQGELDRAMARLEGTLAELDEMMGRRAPGGGR